MPCEGGRWDARCNDPDLMINRLVRTNNTLERAPLGWYSRREGGAVRQKIRKEFLCVALAEPTRARAAQLGRHPPRGCSL